MRILIVEDDFLVSRSIATTARTFGDTVVVPSAATARCALAGTGEWAAFLLDVGLPDGSGMDVLQFARRSHPTTPALCLTGLIEPELANKAFDLGATCIWKPYEPQRLKRFLRDASMHEFGKIDPIELAVQDWALRYRLTSAETDVLRKTVAGETCEWIGESRGTTTSTIKSLWKQIRMKTGDPTIAGITNRLPHEAAGIAGTRT
jgi:DNA-binding NarL/FixJ family response regulator